MEAMEDFPGEMGDILDIVQTVSRYFGYCGVLWKRGDFPGKMGKVLRLVWGSPSNAGGEVYLPAIYTATITFYTS